MPSLTPLEQQLVLPLSRVWAVEVWSASGLQLRVECGSAYHAIVGFNEFDGEDVRLMRGPRIIRRRIAPSPTL